MKEMAGCKTNHEKSSATKVSENVPSVFLMFKISSFKDMQNEHDVYRGKDCMKMFCESLREHANEYNEFKKKKMKLLTKKQQESYKKDKNLLYL